jgi:hypothetical protein
MPNTKPEEKTKLVQPVSPATAPEPQNQDYPSNIPQVAGGANANIPSVLNPSQPKDSEFKGNYKKTDSGEPYALAVVSDDALGRTHKAKNSLHYWEGTAQEFKNQFDVSENDKRVQTGDADKGDQEK